jgi:signal peptidase I
MRPQNNKRGRLTILVLILVMVAIEFVHSSVGTFCVVEGDSMYPTFSPNDVVQARTLHASSARGDVVIVTDDRGDRVIKRIIGPPGETVTIYRGFVYINGKRLSEPYLPRHTYTFKCAIEDESPAKWCLGDDEFFVLGDNRLESRDSRAFGPVERQSMHSVVSLPGNAPRPGFCDIILSESGKAIPGKHSPFRNRPADDHQNSGAKI